MDTLAYAELPNHKLIKRGKVRDIFEIDEERLLIVTTDRISVFDRILESLIPEKGKILNKISSYWFNIISQPNHFITNDIDEIIDNPLLSDRCMVVKQASPLPVECVVRGYLAGSFLEAYKNSEKVCDIILPEGLKDYAKLPEPIFTPTTKESGAHDRPLTFLEFKNLVGTELAQILKELSIAIYEEGNEISEKKGIIIADSKFEFGIDSEGNLILIDELLTPDSSRIWDLKLWEKGEVFDLDKEFVRNYIRSAGKDTGVLPEEVIQKTSERYKRILEIIVGI